MHDYQFQMTPLALQDMDEALSYIKDTLCNPQAAQNLIREIDVSIQKIRKFPFGSHNILHYKSYLSYNIRIE